MKTWKQDATNILIVGYIVFILLFIILISSCNPVKRVLNDKDKLDDVAEVVVKLGYCANDTIIVTKSDTTIVHDTSYRFDTIINIGFHNDTQYVTLPRKVITKTVTIRDTVKSVVVDNARVNLLQKDLIKLEAEADRWKSTAKKRWWILVLFIGASIGYILRKPIKLAIFGKI